ncbi:DUF3108 domain-containing protein [Prolixibacteraceae bacterium JC049]|nr:DUF3108 domain-containing protein [Prolixibacteraceae bacterium JC049]
MMRAISVVGLFIFLCLNTVAQGQPNELLKYNFRFGIIKAGKATFIARDTTFKNLPTTHLSVRGRTTGLVDALYKVDDRYESIIDNQTKLPYKAIRNVRERKYRYYNEVTFDQEKHIAVSQKSGERVIPAKLNDMLSMFFYFRQDNLLSQLQVGDTIPVPLWHADKINKINIKYLGIKPLKTKFGKINCHVIAPQFKKGKLFKKTDAVTLWLSNDANMVPLLLELDIRYGALRCEIIEYKRKNGVHLK